VATKRSCRPNWAASRRGSARRSRPSKRRSATCPSGRRRLHPGQHGSRSGRSSSPTRPATSTTASSCCRWCSRPTSRP
jgi:hypothetical protein